MKEDLYDALGEAWGIPRAEAKIRAYEMVFGIRTPDRTFLNIRERLDCQMVNEIKSGALSEASALQSLGSENTTYIYEGANTHLLEAFPNPLKALPDNAFGRVTIVAPEFTSLCPKTGQPDFATIVVEYTPRDLCVESKSLKLYLGSFRQVGEFHEACVARIARDLVALLDPMYLMVRGEFTPRGGIKFWPEVTYHGKPGDYVNEF